MYKIYYKFTIISNLFNKIKMLYGLITNIVILYLICLKGVYKRYEKIYK